MNNYLTAKAIESGAFLAIEGEGTDAQWDAYFDAQDATNQARNAMLDAACAKALTMIKDENSRQNVTAFFELAKLREGETRERAILKAFELAQL